MCERRTRTEGTRVWRYKSFYEAYVYRQSCTGRFPWRLCVVFIRPSATAAKDRRRPLSVARRFVHISILYCVSVYMGVWVCLCAMLAGVSFFRNRIRKDVLHPARPVPVVFHYLISSSAHALSVVKSRFRKTYILYISVFSMQNFAREGGG